MNRSKKKGGSKAVGGLGVREELFLAEYIKSGGNGTQAVLKSGITDNADSAKVIAHRLLTDVNVLRRINEWQESLKLEQREALGRLSQIARASLEDFFIIDEKGHPAHDFRGAYQSGALSNLKRLDKTVSTHTNGDGESEEVTRVEIEMLSPIDAINLMSKILGWEKQPQQNPGEAAYVLSYVRKAMELQINLHVRSGQFITLPEVIRAMLNARPDLARDEPLLERHGVIAKVSSQEAGT
jgi:hypothetical protein